MFAAVLIVLSFTSISVSRDGTASTDRHGVTRHHDLGTAGLARRVRQRCIGSPRWEDCPGETAGNQNSYQLSVISLNAGSQLTGPPSA